MCVHYHVTTISPSISIEPVITKTEKEAAQAFGNMVGLVYLRTGLLVRKYGARHVSFDGDTTVRYYECGLNCLRENGKVA